MTTLESLISIFFILVLCTLIIRCLKGGGNAIYLILVLAFFLKCSCGSDLYLHEWDERYHALVAKNMLDNPLKPTLYKSPIHSYQIDDWTNNHIWLSKPPLGLFVVACSVGIFGNHEYAVRLPGIIASLIAVYLVYLVFKRVYNEKIGLLSAFFVGIHGVLTDLASGRLSSDAIETLFLLSVFYGVYLIIYNDDDKSKYRTHLKVGLITGVSFMIKWQPALLILLLYAVDQFAKVDFRKAFLRCTMAFICAAILPAMWIFYAMNKYPTEMTWMLKAIFNPLYGTVENNDSRWYSQLTNFGMFFGYSSFVVLFFYMSRRKVLFHQHRLLMLIWILVPLVIFGMAEIKRGTYLMISAPAIITLTVSLYYENWKWRNWNIAATTALVSFISIGVLSLEKLYLFSKDKSHVRDWSTEIKNRHIAPGSVLYNEPHYIEVMFYHDVIAYPKSKEWYQRSLANEME